MARLDALRITQTQLAEAAGVTQGTIASLISGRSRGSKHLHLIARTLRTTPEYLLGDTDDPEAGAPAPLPTMAYSTVVMHVALPGTNALSAMFRGLLRHVDLTQSRADIARQLAETLPIGLAQLSDLAPDPIEVRDSDAASLPASSPAMRHPEPQS